MLNVLSAGGHFCFTHLAILSTAQTPERESLTAEQGVRRACKLTAMQLFTSVLVRLC